MRAAAAPDQRGAQWVGSAGSGVTRCSMDAWNLTAGSDDWSYQSHQVAPIKARWAWTPGQRHSVMAAWPPRGVELRVDFKPPTRCGCGCNLRVSIVYEMYDYTLLLINCREPLFTRATVNRYDNVPTLAKRVEVRAPPSSSSGSVLVERVVTEELHVTENGKRRVHVETDYMPRKTFWGFAQQPSSDPGNGSYAGDRMNYPVRALGPIQPHDRGLTC